MAIRPIFIVGNNKRELVKELDIDFKFYNGFAITQKAKSIKSLHEKSSSYGSVLEVSTKSDNKIGWNLSAFNLLVDFQENQKITLECAFQGSKVFENNQQYKDIYYCNESIRAKKDERLKNSGSLIGFDFQGTWWELEPKTAFYDWLYISAIYNNHPELLDELIKFDVFTDIEFNPKKSINCQARTCAILVSLIKLNIIEEALSSIESFKSIVYKKPPMQTKMIF